MEENQTKYLIEKCLSGDPLSQHRLFNLYIKAMYNTVFRLTGNEHQAQDVVQEGFIKAFSRMQQFNHQATFGAWLKRIMINTALDSLKKYSPEFTDLEIVQNHSDENDGDHASFPSPKVVNEEILKLPEGCRIVFTLYQLEGYEQSEIAKELGISVSTVKTQYRRARLLLKERLMALRNERSI